MRNKLFLPVLTFLGASIFVSYTGTASAALVMGYETTYNGSTLVTTGPGTINTPLNPSSNDYGNSFTGPTLVIPSSPSPGYGFYDDYIFTISGATANSISTTIDLSSMLQITNFQERLFNYSGNPSPTLGSPVGGAIDAWVTPIGIGTVAVLPTTVLAPGTYVLQMRGNVTGTNGGSYAGTLNVVPVPLPAAAWLFGSGLLGLGAFARRRQN